MIEAAQSSGSRSNVAGGSSIPLLEEISRRVLWLAARMVDSANHDRDTGDGVKVGGHQASSASLVTVLTALCFAHLDAADRVAVKPHASPVFHAIQYLLGKLDRSYLTRLRALRRPAVLPQSRTKDPDGVDFSTGSVGLGAAAPLFAAAARRYVDAHFGAAAARRFIAADRRRRTGRGQRLGGGRRPGHRGPGQRHVDRRPQPAVAGPGRAGHPDRAVAAAVRRRPAGTSSRSSTAAGCRGLRPARRRRAAATGIDACRTSATSRCSACAGAALREQFLDGAPGRGRRPLLATVPDDGTAPRWSPTSAATTWRACSTPTRPCDAVTDRPSVVFAYTVKGWGLPIAGNPRNHSALLTDRADRRAARRRRADRGHRVGPPRPGHAGRRAGGAPARGSSPRPAPAPAIAGHRARPSTGLRSSKPRVHAGGVRPGAGRAWPATPEVAPLPGHHRAGRRHLDQPGRLHQPCRRVRARRAARVLERRPGAALDRGPDRPAHRARHLPR